MICLIFLLNSKSNFTSLNMDDHLITDNFEMNLSKSEKYLLKATESKTIFYLFRIWRNRFYSFCSAIYKCNLRLDWKSETSDMSEG